MTLNEEQKEWIVTQWAMMIPASQILKGFEERFGAAITANQARDYNPTTARTRGKSMRKWKVLHDHIRHKFLTEIADIPIANASVRLHRLEQLCVGAMAKGNAPLAAEIIEQAAKEVGGLFTNKREIEGHVENNHKHNHSHDFGAEEARGILGDFLAKAVEAAQGAGTTKH